MQKNQNEKIYKTDAICLIQELILAMNDSFVWNARQRGNTATLRLENGQTFELSLREVQ